MRRHAWNCDLSTKPGTDILTNRHILRPNGDLGILHFKNPSIYIYIYIYTCIYIYICNMMVRLGIWSMGAIDFFNVHTMIQWGCKATWYDLCELQGPHVPTSLEWWPVDFTLPLGHGSQALCKWRHDIPLQKDKPFTILFCLTGNQTSLENPWTQNSMDLNGFIAGKSLK